MVGRDSPRSAARTQGLGQPAEQASSDLAAEVVAVGVGDLVAEHTEDHAVAGRVLGVGHPLPVIAAYGHGGADVTLSWGTTEAVLRLVRELDERSIAEPETSH